MSLRARRLPAARIGTLVVLLTMWCASTVALAKSSGGSWSVVAVHHGKHAGGRASSKKSLAKRTKCADAARRAKRRSGGAHSKAVKACARKKKRASKQGESSKQPGVDPALTQSVTGVPQTLAGGDSFVEPLASQVVEPELTSEQTGGSVTPPAKAPVAGELPPVFKLPPEAEKPPAVTTTSLTSSADPSTVGEAVTYTATLSATGATGTVEFKDGGVAIVGCAAQTVSFGSANCTVPGYGTAGTHSIIANYSGDGNYLVSTSSVLTQTVNEVATTTSLTSTANPSMVGQAVTYTATLSAIAATGTVEFKDGGVAIAGCTAQAISFGSATCAAAGYTTAGLHSITATYSGDGNYLVSTSSVLTQTVNEVATTTSLTSSADPSTVGEAVTYTATLSATGATGTVEFKDGGVAIAGCTAQAISFGSATCAAAGYTTAGSHSITATYSGDGNYARSTSSLLNQVVSQVGASTTTSLTSSADPSTVGEAVTYTAMLSAIAATGTVEFRDGGVAIAGCTAQTISSGAANCTVSGYGTVGDRSITATYSGDGDYLASTSSVLTQTVNEAATTTSLSSSADSSMVGEAVTFTASVSPAVATGTVEFRDGGVAIAGCTAQTISSGTANCTVSGYGTAGNRSITAIFSGGSNYLGSSSTALIQEVGQAVTTTSLTSSADPSTVGEAVTYTATLSATGATGTVEFKDGGVAIVGCAAQTVSFGSANCTVPGYGTAGTHSIIANYSGDGNYLPFVSATLTQTISSDQGDGQIVSKTATATVVSSSLDPSTAGEAVTYTATVSPATATGIVEFRQGGVTITSCATQAISAGTAKCTVAYPAAGGYGITAFYAGDSNYASSWSPGLTQTVKKRTTTMTVASSSNPSTVGEAVTYTATVSSTAATGTVEFEQGGVTIAGCGAKAVSSGVATCTVAGLAAGGYWITAAYSGDNSYGSSSFPGLTQTVKKKVATTVVSSSLDPSTAGEAVTYTATVSPATATGIVEFRQGGVTITSCATQAISAGTAKCTVAYPAAGGYGITAFYAGDSNYASSWSPGLTQTVKKRTTTMTVASSSNPSTVGEAVTYTATVSSTAATGTVEFEQGGVTIAGCGAKAVSSGVATCTVAGLAAGGYWITAAYSGDNSYGSSSFPGLTQTVKKKVATTVVSSSLDPSTAGEAVTYTATVSPATATGIVEFRQGGVTITSCATQAISAGTAKCTVAYPAAGGYGITAFYAGDSNYASSWSPGLTQTVKKRTTTMTVASSSNPSTVGEAVTYTATVSSTAATGTVEFEQGGVTIAGCGAKAVSSGVATCTVAGLAAGGYWITAAYSGDNSYGSSSFPGLTQTVKKKVATTVVSSSLDPSTAGEAVTYTATVSPATATGIVEFRQGGVTITSCATQAISAGTAKCTVAYPAAGGYGITAFYAGDSNYASSWSPGLTQTVKKRTTTMTVASSSNPSTVGEAVTYTATVSSTAATGTVEFMEEGTPIAGCAAEAISSGAATCTVAGYPSWSSYTITAAYSGDNSDLASGSSTLTQTVEPPVESTGPFRFFSPSSFWNKELPTDAPLDPSSAAVVGAFDEDIAEEEEGKGPFINTTSWSVPIYTVPADQPRVKVTLWDPSRAAGGPALQTAWDEVPLPPDAKPSLGSDANLVVWQPSTDRMWEFWRLEQAAGGWEAAWGGAVQNVLSDSGSYDSEAWPGAEHMWGASASSLSIVGGLITLEDLERGKINHALEISIPNPRAGVYASPAHRTDGTSTELSSLPEGAHLRLDPSLDLAALHLPRLTLMLAEAAQRYGIVIRDTAGDIAFYGQEPMPTGTNPYAGAHGYYEGKSVQQLLTSFPWSHLQLLKMELHSTS